MALSYDDPFQSYTGLPGLGNAIPQITDSSVKKVLRDRQKRLQGMALIFDLESPRKFNKDTLATFGSYFVRHINNIVSSPDPAFADKIIKSYIGNRQNVIGNLLQAKVLISQLLRDFDKNSKFTLYDGIKRCTIFFEQALAHWGPRESLRILNPDLTILTEQQCKDAIQKIYNYLTEDLYGSISDENIENFEKELRLVILLTVLERDISQREEILMHLREAKTSFNLILTPQKGKSRDRIFLLGKCEDHFRDILHCWNST